MWVTADLYIDLDLDPWDPGTEQNWIRCVRASSKLSYGDSTRKPTQHNQTFAVVQALLPGECFESSFLHKVL